MELTHELREHSGLQWVVTGGFHGGNRLGGNAISEAITTGRVAGNSVVLDQ